MACWFLLTRPRWNRISNYFFSATGLFVYFLNFCQFTRWYRIIRNQFLKSELLYTFNQLNLSEALLIDLKVKFWVAFLDKNNGLPLVTHVIFAFTWKVEKFWLFSSIKFYSSYCNQNTYTITTAKKRSN